MNTLHQGFLLTIAAATCTSALQAQTITPLIVEGDSASWGSSIVERIENVDVNNRGDWLAEVDADPTGALFMVDLGIVHNGTLIYEEGTNLGFPASHSAWNFSSTISAMDINDNGDILVQLLVVDAASGLMSRTLVLWTNGVTGTTYVLFETDVTPTDTMLGEPAGFEEPAGAVYDRITTVWQNNNNQLVVRCRSTADLEDMLVFVEHDGAGTIMSQTMFATEGAVHDQAFPPANGTHALPVTAMSYRPIELALNNDGQTMFFLDDDQVGSSSDVDSHYYIDSDEIAWEADMAPTGSGFPYGDLRNAEVDINDSGEWVAVWDDDGPAATDKFIAVSGSIFVKEGDLVPGFDPMLGFVLSGSFFGPVQISLFGEVTWLGQWNDPNTSIDSGLFRDQNLIVQEGITMIGGRAVTSISTSHDGLAVSDSGQYILVELTVDAQFGPDLEGIYLIDVGEVFRSFCNGDGGNQLGCTDCPCGNNSPAGTLGGCMNSTSQSTRLAATGLSSVTLPPGSTTDLQFTLTGAPPSTLCVLTSGDGVAPVNMAHPCFGQNSGVSNGGFDGLQCAVVNVRRHGMRRTDPNGDVGATNHGWGGAAGPDAGIAGASGFVAGQSRYFQVVHRDDPMALCASGLNSSQAVQVLFLP